MSCKIEIDPFNKKAGKLCYLMMTQDAASLEARVCTSDTVLNKNGIDKVLFSVYDPVHGNNDLHSTTSFATFGSSVNLQINEIVDENGKTWLCLDDQSIVVKRDGQQITVLGKELKETDEIVGYVEDVA